MLQQVSFISVAGPNRKGFGIMKKRKSRFSIFQVEKTLDRKNFAPHEKTSIDKNQKMVQHLLNNVWSKKKALCQLNCWKSVRVVIQQVGRKLFKMFVFIGAILVGVVIGVWYSKTDLIGLDATTLNRNVHPVSVVYQQLPSKTREKTNPRPNYLYPKPTWQNESLDKEEAFPGLQEQLLQNDITPDSKIEILRQRSSITVDLGVGVAHTKLSKNESEQNKVTMSELRNYPKPKFQVTDLLTPWFKDINAALNVGLVEMSKYELWLKSHNIDVDASLKYALDITNYNLTPRQVRTYFATVTPLKQTLNAGLLLERSINKDNLFQMKLEVQNHVSPSFLLMDPKTRPNVSLKTTATMGLLRSNNTSISVGLSSSDVYKANKHKTGLQFAGFFEIKSQFFNNKSKHLGNLKGGYIENNVLANVHQPLRLGSINNRSIERRVVFEPTQHFSVPEQMERVSRRLYKNVIPGSNPSFKFDENCLLEIVHGEPLSITEQKRLIFCRVINKPSSLILPRMLYTIWEVITIKAWRGYLLTVHEKTFIEHYSFFSNRLETFVNDNLRAEITLALIAYHQKNWAYMFSKQLFNQNRIETALGLLASSYTTSSVNVKQMLLPVVRLSTPIALMSFSSYGCLLFGLGQLIGSSFAISTGAIIGFQVYRLGFHNTGHTSNQNLPVLPANEFPLGLPLLDDPPQFNEDEREAYERRRVGG